jgi:hypothetical protein
VSHMQLEQEWACESGERATYDRLGWSGEQTTYDRLGWSGEDVWQRDGLRGDFYRIIL